MSKQSSKEAELRAEIALLRANHGANNLTKIVQDLIRYGAYVALAWFGSIGIHDLSGKVTKADIHIDANADATVTMNKGHVPAGNAAEQHISTLCQDMAPVYLQQSVVLLSLVFGGACWMYGRHQARLRKDVVTKFHPYQVAAEKQMNPSRTSSHLSKGGETRPEDL